MFFLCENLCLSRHLIGGQVISGFLLEARRRRYIGSYQHLKPLDVALSDDKILWSHAVRRVMKQETRGVSRGIPFIY